MVFFFLSIIEIVKVEFWLSMILVEAFIHTKRHLIVSFEINSKSIYDEMDNLTVHVLCERHSPLKKENLKLLGVQHLHISEGRK